MSADDPYSMPSATSPKTIGAVEIKQTAERKNKKPPSSSLVDDFRTPACGLAFSVGLSLGFCLALAAILRHGW